MPLPLDDTNPVERVDDEIAQIRAQIDFLRKRRSLLSTTLLSHRKTRQRLHHAQKQHQPRHYHHHSDPAAITHCLSRLCSQHDLNVTNTHRLCAGATCFEVHDPDPHAVDSGRVLGVRIDILDVDGAATVPCTLLLHRPYPALTQAWRVHRHTVPAAAVRLDELVGRYLPFPKVDERTGVVKEGGGKGQDLVGLVREVRRKVVGWRRRVGAVEGLKGEYEGDRGVKEILVPDVEGREVRIEWTDGRVALLRIAEDGVVEGCTVRDADGAEDRAAQRALMDMRGCNVAAIGGRIRELHARWEET